ncbi:MAG: glycosyltransferase family 1 protein [Alphaproteobacteria bacterium]|nr:MAG: glycosyltransferase family 1 protein [Alphaproteobacteria bacterium]
MTETSTLRRLRVLLSAYACEPGKGSEPGTGWHMAMELAKRYDVTVLTRANDRGPIEKELAESTGPRPTFLYHDLSGLYRFLKKRRILPTQLYYAMWQRDTRRMLETKSVSDFDIFHHITFNSFEISPGVPAGFRGALVRGPLGGGQTAPPALLESLGWLDKLKEQARSARVRKSAASSRLQRDLAACDLILHANHETGDLLKQGQENRRDPMIDVGVDPSKFSPADHAKDGTRILSASNFEPRKGTRLLLLAFQRAHQDNPSLRLLLAGSGKLLAQDMAWVEANRLSNSVSFLGKLDHQKMADELSAADVFVFPSLRDTSGAIVLEAMACGLPIVCLDHQGAKVMVGDCCGMRISPESLEGTLDGIARAILKLASNVSLRESMGHRARERVLAEFSWEKKASRLSEEYQRLV